MKGQFFVFIIVLSLVVTGFSWRRRRRRSCFRYCSVSGWGSWGSCSATCGSSGLRYRYRYKTLWEQCGGTCPYAMSQPQACNRRCCPRPCSYYYTSWSTCSGCGTNGRQYRRAVIRTYPACGGTACPSTSYQYRTCNTGRLVDFLFTGRNTKKYCTLYFSKNMFYFMRCL